MLKIFMYIYTTYKCSMHYTEIIYKKQKNKSDKLNFFYTIY